MSSFGFPTTHISSLANLYRDFCIQIIPSGDLVGALDSSADLRHGQTMEQDFIPLLDDKERNCSEWFRTNLTCLGIQEPLVIIVYPGNVWLLDNGHHRLAWALLMGLNVPVIFDDSGAGDESTLSYLVGRENVDVYHNTIAEDMITTAEVRMMDEINEHLARNAAVIPRQRGRHRQKAGGSEGGRHRAAN